MGRRTFNLSLLFFILCAVLGGAYTYAWLYTAQLIRTQISALYDDAAKVGMRIEGDFPLISGFPGPHAVHFSGKLVEGPQTLNLPDLCIRGLFLPGHNVSISLPQGASLEGATDPALFSIKDMEVDAVIPVMIPASLNAEDLNNWQRNNGMITISRFHMQKESLILDGTGQLALDSDLQPTGTATVHIKGYSDFLDWLKGKGILRDKQAAFADMVLTGLSRTDTQTGENYIKTDLNLKSRTLYLGPLGVLTLQPVVWASRNQPVPPQ